MQPGKPLISRWFRYPVLKNIGINTGDLTKKEFTSSSNIRAIPTLNDLFSASSFIKVLGVIWAFTAPILIEPQSDDTSLHIEPAWKMIPLAKIQGRTWSTAVQLTCTSQKGWPLVFSPNLLFSHPNPLFSPPNPLFPRPNLLISRPFCKIEK